MVLRVRFPQPGIAFPYGRVENNQGEDMRTIKTQVFYYDELSEEVKEKIVYRLWDINVDYDWWHFVFEDAENIGLKIIAFDADRRGYIDGRMLLPIEESIKAILQDHGKECDTYKLAIDFSQRLSDLWRNHLPQIEEDEYNEYDDEYERLSDEYEHALKEEYVCILRREYEYRTSEETIVESIRANEFEFTEDGKMV